MKPKHRWGRTRKGKYTTLRQYVHVIKGDNDNFVELQIASGVPASLAIAPIPRSYSNNKLKMAGKPMIRKQQEYIAKRRAREQAKNIKQQEYSRMELGRRNSAVEKRFRHKPYGIGE